MRPRVRLTSTTMRKSRLALTFFCALIVVASLFLSNYHHHTTLFDLREATDDRIPWLSSQTTSASSDSHHGAARAALPSSFNLRPTGESALVLASDRPYLLLNGSKSVAVEDEFFKHSPANTPGPFQSCAIVGNSGSLLHRSHGPAIDQNDVIFRINYAPVSSKFLPSIGNRTTFDIVNRENAKRMASKNFAFRESILIFFEAASPTNREKIFLKVLRTHPILPRIWFLQPRFVSQAQDLYARLKSYLEKTEGRSFQPKPMTGYITVRFAMEICKSIHLYGFDDLKNSNNSNSATVGTPPSAYHYFDEVKPVLKAHSFDMAILIYQLISRSFPLFIH